MSEQRLTRRTRFKNWLRKMIALVLNPRFLLCFCIAWLITNGWAYIMLGFGIWREIEWMSAVAGAYLAFLWIPITPEKIVTTAIAIVLLRRFFPNDEKTMGVLREWHTNAKNKWQSMKKKKKKDTPRADRENDD